MDRVLETRSRLKKNEKRTKLALAKSSKIKEDKIKGIKLKIHKKELKRNFELYKKKYIACKAINEKFYKNWIVMIQLIKFSIEINSTVRNKLKENMNIMHRVILIKRVKFRWDKYIKNTPKNFEDRSVLDTKRGLLLKSNFSKKIVEKKCKREINHFFILMTSCLQFKHFFNQKLLASKF